MIIDIRDYRLVPGTRERLLERCETVYFPEQERLGARLVGVFRDADDPDRYVWLRAMPDLDTRKRVLTAFYEHGEIWQRDRTEVNTWIADSDDVLLVRPRGELAAPATGPSVVGMYTYLRREPLADPTEIDRTVTAAVAAAGGRMLATFATDPVENNYPRHPIRTGEHGLVWFATFAAHRPLAIDVVAQRRLLPTEHSRMR